MKMRTTITSALAALLLLTGGALAQDPDFGGIADGSSGGSTPPFSVDPEASAEELLQQAEELLARIGEAFGTLFIDSDWHVLEANRATTFYWDGRSRYPRAKQTAATLTTRFGELAQLMPTALSKSQAAGAAIQGRAVAVVTRYNVMLDWVREKNLRASITGFDPEDPLYTGEAGYLRAPEAKVGSAEAGDAAAAVSAAQAMAQAAGRLKQQVIEASSSSLRAADATAFRRARRAQLEFADQMVKLKAARNRALFLAQASDGGSASAFSRLDSQYQVLATWGDSNALTGPRRRKTAFFMEGVASKAGEGGKHPFASAWLLGGQPSPSAAVTIGGPGTVARQSATGGFAEDPSAAQSRADARESTPGGAGGATSGSVDARARRRAGHVANDFTDEHVDDVLRNATSIHEVYTALGNILGKVYPPNSAAGRTIHRFQAFLTNLRWKLRPEGATGADTTEMPMAIDQLMGVLRAERADAGDNVKAQLYAALTLPILHLRGITYRVRPLVDRSFGMHTQAINQLRAWKLNFPLSGGTTAEAFFEFFTYPMANRQGVTVQFHSASDVQTWLTNHFIPTLDESIALTEAALGRMENGDKLSLDLSVITAGPNPFPDPGKEAGARSFGKAEVHHLLAGLYWLRGGLKASCMYDLDDYIAMANAGTDRLLKSFLREKVPFGRTPRKGWPAKDRFQVVEDFPNVFRLKNGRLGSQVLADTRAGWAQYKTAVEGYLAAKPGSGAGRMANTDWYQGGRRDWLIRFKPRVDGMLSGAYSLPEFVGGTSTKIDLPGLLSSPPQDLHDFLPHPTNFSQGDSGAHYRDFEFSSGKISYTAYGYGNPRGWKMAKADGSWKKLFPELTNVVAEGGAWMEPYRAFHQVSRSHVGYLLTPWLSLAFY